MKVVCCFKNDKKLWYIFSYLNDHYFSWEFTSTEVIHNLGNSSISSISFTN